jgi:hypothetical protein
VHAVVFIYEWNVSTVVDVAVMMFSSSDAFMVKYSDIFVSLNSPESMGHD